MNYVKNLIELVCGSNGQIYNFISKEMRYQDDVVNGTRSNGRTNATGRGGELQALGPLYKETYKDIETTYLQAKPRKTLNNNPEYSPNIIQRLKTPFDYIDRILLQDFTKEQIPDKSDSAYASRNYENYFRDLFTIKFRNDSTTSGTAEYKNTYGVIDIMASDPRASGDTTYTIDYTKINNLLHNSTSNKGEFVVDSFTYTPFIDYATYDSKIGIYQDEFLTDYNCGRYEESYSGSGKRVQADKNRRTLTSNLFQLRNLEKDLNDAKFNFRNAIDASDKKTYIYVFCRHLAELFAKLSNIRMCHEIYGMKNPHHKWEGILALDIWYNLLYQNIDRRYPFDDKYFNMNPMSRLPIQKDSGGNYVEFKSGRKLYLMTDGTVKDNGSVLSKMEWIPDNTIDSSEKEQFAFIWDENMWLTYNNNSHLISDRRAECVTPRSVLGKINDIINNILRGGEHTNVIKRKTNGDFDWFFQKGKVYSDQEKQVYSKYTNLHLGLAYDEMPAIDYCELTKTQAEFDALTTYVKPKYSEAASDIREKMLDKGIRALQDAFSVILSEKLFNIYNSTTNQIEEFNPTNSRSYTQSQCAIVIERIFSRLYKYLQFKSTTGEVFQRHINIDSGYKYLTTETLNKSENTNSHVYYKETESEPGYLRYLTKLAQYTGTSPAINIGLTSAEKDVLDQFIDIVSSDTADWIYNKWNLCPLCLQVDSHTEKPLPRNAPEVAMLKSSSRDSIGGGGGAGFYRNLTIDLNLTPYMSWSSGSVSVKNGSGSVTEVSGKPSTVEVESYGEFSFNLGDILFATDPTYTDGSGEAAITVKYELAGYSTDRWATNPSIVKTDYITDLDFGESHNLRLYAIWNTQYIVKFAPGVSSSIEQPTMTPLVISSGEVVNLPKCIFNGPTATCPEFKYFESTKDPKSWSNNVSALNGASEVKNLYRFKEWTYSFGGVSGTRPDQGSFGVQRGRVDSAPVIILTAKWEKAYSLITFMVRDEKYCEALIDNSLNEIPEVATPVLTGRGENFLAWDYVPGDVIQGVDQSQTIICGSRTDNTLSDEWKDGSEYIICEDTSMSTYSTVVRARITTDAAQSFLVMFKYVDATGKNQEKKENCLQNTHIPSFHVHINVPLENGNTLKFRYWRLKSGNITSSMTVMSDCVLVAVYDEIKPQNNGKTEAAPEKNPNKLVGLHTFESGQRLVECDYLSSDLNRDGDHYCTLSGLYPKKYETNFDELKNCLKDDGSVHVSQFDGCPFVRMMNRAKAQVNDFKPLTMLEIVDVVNLLKALFKINIHIAHTEYFLRIDIPEQADWWYGYKDGSKWISFEPTVEFKFCNLHAANQLQNGKLVCTTKTREDVPVVVPVNRELLNDTSAVHYSDLFYYYDYRKSLQSVQVKERKNPGNPPDSPGELVDVSVTLDDNQRYYQVKKLCAYQNSRMQSPVDENDFIRHRAGEITRNNRQLQTFTSIVKKYRPLMMPKVRDIFNDCQGQNTKYEADLNNDYGVFGWCTIPSKIMVNMEYNEDSIIIPSSYDHFNRVGGSNFLQMDKDFENVYKKWIDRYPDNDEIIPRQGHLEQNVKNTWYYLYNQRDWTYFLKPFFNVSQNSDIYSYMWDTYGVDEKNGSIDYRPEKSDHLNGVIFEPSNEGRDVDLSFGDIARACEFLAKRHHNENNLKILADRYTKLLTFDVLKNLTTSSDSGGDGDFNSVYGSKYTDTDSLEDFRFPYQDWVDDYDWTGSYVKLGVDKYKVGAASDGGLKYAYNLGQSHAIDDFDDGSVWFYITMVSPIEDLNQVIELEDIMPYVFWWENRGDENNGPTVDCYGRMSNAKLNYEQGGWCYSNAHEKQDESIEVNSTTGEETRTPLHIAEHRWHAVQHTIGTDFSKDKYGGTILTTDNSGNCYKGAFDPNCAGSNEKWKIHHMSNAFGAPQHEDPTADKYYLGEKAHGDGEFRGKQIPESMNNILMDSIKDRPMTWNLWNCVRQYAYIKYFKNRHRDLGNELSNWQELEKYTKKLVRSIYRTFKQNKWKDNLKTNGRSTFTDVDGSSTNYGGVCQVHWTNSFVEITDILERNAREHKASFVLFTGDIKPPTDDQISRMIVELQDKYPKKRGYVTYAMARAKIIHDAILASSDNFRVVTLEGVDDDLDGMRSRQKKGVDPYGGFESDDPKVRDIVPPVRIYQGFKYEDLPTTYVLGDSLTYSQLLPDINVQFKSTLDMDKEFPESEYYLNNTSQKWIRKITKTVMNKQIFPVYTSMEGMDKSHHDLTMTDMKSITFQIVPQFYWKYDWSYNQYMIHRVGKLQAPSENLKMYDMLGNVWEWVRDDWDESDRPISKLNGKNNAICGTQSNDGGVKKVIKGGAFNQLIRKVISPAREGVAQTECQSEFSDQANIGFRPALVFTSENEGGSFTPGVDPVDLFFLFDASESQDNQVREMLNAAKRIVAYFAGTRENPDICHVGSALFLGPTIKFMCAHQCRELDQTLWAQSSRTVVEGSTEKPKEPYYHHYSYSSVWAKKNSPWGREVEPQRTGWSQVDINHSPQHEPDVTQAVVPDGAEYAGLDRRDWIKVNNNSSFSQMSSGDGADGKSTGFHVKIRHYIDNCWMCGEEGAKTISDIAMEDVEQPINWEDTNNVEIETLYGDEDLKQELFIENGKIGPRLGTRDGSGTGGCFVAGTQVLLPNGEQKNIEELKVGDDVVSYNEETGENETSKVKETMVHDVDEDIYTFTIEGDELDVTGNHKFYIMRKNKKSWIRADELVVGDLVMFHDRSLHRISKIASQKLSTGVFNIEVTKNHNYYVGRKHILAHNKGDCFVAGTKVLMADGTKKDIDKIEEGELVLSYNETTGKNEYCQVVKTLRHLLVREIFAIRIGDEVIEATGVHPFYVNRGGKVLWVKAQDLLVSDMLMRPNGTWDTIDNIDIALKLGYVYNLEVSVTHTYYVGEQGVLVHNKPGGGGDGGGECFIAGTPVTLADYSKKAIEQIEVGDVVLSYNEKTGMDEGHVVKELFVHKSESEPRLLYTLQIGNDTITVTGEHRFYVFHNGQARWSAVVDVSPGDMSRFSDGTWHEIKVLKVEKSMSTVYNFEVEGTHTYYVGNSNILVHNKKVPWYPWGKHTNYIWSRQTKSLYINCGVPAWQETISAEYKAANPGWLGEQDVIDYNGGVRMHFGDLSLVDEGSGDWGKYFPGYVNTRGYAYPAVDAQAAWGGRYKFFTYDPTENGIADFEFPFTPTNMGVISNWWAGCEPVCDMLSKLVRNGYGYFFGYPWHKGQAYLFRKKVPRLIFVFTNEYDNSMVKTYSYEGGIVGHEIVVTPGSEDGSSISFYGKLRASKLMGRNQYAPDPCCLQIFNNGNGEAVNSWVFEEYYHTVTGEYPTSVQIGALIDIGSTYNVQNAYGMVFHQPANAKVVWKIGDLVAAGAKIRTNDISQSDLNMESNPFYGMSGDRVLTYEQCSSLYNTGNLPGITPKRNARGVVTGLDTIKYDALKTIGFYQLRNSLSYVSDPTNIYAFVSDANAPVPLYEPNMADKKDIANSLILEKDDELWLGSAEKVYNSGGLDAVPLSGTPFYSPVVARGFGSGAADTGSLSTGQYYGADGKSKYLAYKILRMTNLQWHANREKPDLGVNMDNANAAAAKRVFGLENPYTKITIVWALRKNWSSFMSGQGISSGFQKIIKGQGDSGVEHWQYTNVVSNSSEKSSTLYWAIFVGMPACHTGSKKDENSYTEGSWRACLDGRVKEGTKKVKLSKFMADEICARVWTDAGLTIPSNWTRQVAEYVHDGTSIMEVRDGVTLYANMAWLDKHVCPYDQWESKTRFSQGKMCKYNLDEQNLEIVAFTLYEKWNNEPETPELSEVGISDKYKDLLITNLANSESMQATFTAHMMKNPDTSGTSYGGITYQSLGAGVDVGTPDPNGLPDNNYTVDWPNDYITILYRDGYGNVTGRLKIITMNYHYIFSSTPNNSKNAICLNGGKQMKPQDSAQDRAVYASLVSWGDMVESARPTIPEYPPVWNLITICWAKQQLSTYDSKPHSKKSVALWGDTDVAIDMLNFYRQLRVAMPIMMGYRYHNQIFAKMTNMFDRQILEYGDEENTVVAKALPVMDANTIDVIFQNSFESNGGFGNFNTGRQFSFSHCVVDLNPVVSEYNNGLVVGTHKPGMFLSYGKFPMKFKDGLNVNNDDEYKKSKLVLTRINDVSGERFDTEFTMGSHASDYELITDPNKRKYKDDESILDGAVDDYANVVLGNGGSFQRKYVNAKKKDIEEGNFPPGYVASQDFYNITVNLRDKDGKLVLKSDSAGRMPGTPGYVTTYKQTTKYFRNKHLYVDPFELTIAQWCYIKLLTTPVSGSATGYLVANKANARQLLGNGNGTAAMPGEHHLYEIEKSYWEYLAVWENEEWKTLIQHGVDRNGVKVLSDARIAELAVLAPRDAVGTSGTYKPVQMTEVDELYIEKLIYWQIYDPLDDTRPYYYATYQNVRGTAQVYRAGSGTGLMDSSKGDEYQLVDHASANTSFMDILNRNVVFQTQKRIYGTGDYTPAATSYADGLLAYYTQKLTVELVSIETLRGSEYASDGGSPLMQSLMDARDLKVEGYSQSNKKKRWCSGKEGGINFDLPTEAQWEYCCRDHSLTAFPPSYNLVDKFEENHEGLDLIAWYKYKVIGSLPEPERFCSWRISKMLFGISKDKEQINNVYEYFPKS